MRNTRVPEQGANPWIVGRLAAGRPGIRLLCFPQAGGAAGAFTAWRPLLPEGIELLPVELPGRGTRRAEPVPGGMQELVEAVLDAVTAELDAPYALFGHSFGALVAHGLAREIGRRRLPQPRALLLSAAREPHLPPPDAPHGRPDPRDDGQLLEWLRRTGGIPEVLLGDTGYVAMVLDAVRADLALAAGHRAGGPEPLDCPLHVFGGLADPVVPPGELEEWAGYEGPDFTLTLYPGDHFYLYRAPGALLRDIAALTCAGLPAPEGTNAR